MLYTSLKISQAGNRKIVCSGGGTDRLAGESLQLNNFSLSALAVSVAACWANPARLTVDFFLLEDKSSEFSTTHPYEKAFSRCTCPVKRSYSVADLLEERWILGWHSLSLDLLKIPIAADTVPKRCFLLPNLMKGGLTCCFCLLNGFDKVLRSLLLGVVCNSLFGHLTFSLQSQFTSGNASSAVHH